MACTVFYSWQSDLPNKTNRTFIENALENAVKALRNDDSIKVDPVIDRDTAGIPGSPDIGVAIFTKIDNAAVFVCDVSIIMTSSQSRPSPNPNVLIELGYALKSLGPDKVLMLMNTSFGGPELLPFDLRMKRVVTYAMEESAAERAPERRKLEGQLDIALRTILAGTSADIPGEVIDPKSIADQLLESIDKQRPDQVALVRKYMHWLVQELNKLAPDRSAENFAGELLASIVKTAPLVTNFCRVTESISAMKAIDAGLTVVKCFELILNHYNLPRGVSGSYRNSDFDFFKFLGHELFVILIANCLKDGRWGMISDLLEEHIYIDNPYTARPDMASFECISEHLESLIRLGEQRRRVSVHADILKERHTTGELAQLQLWKYFMEADYLLFLRAELLPESDPGLAWRPWSAMYLENTPRFILEATRKKHADNLLKVIGLNDSNVFKKRLAERAPGLCRMWPRRLFGANPLSGFNISEIASRP